MRSGVGSALPLGRVTRSAPSMAPLASVPARGAKKAKLTSEQIQAAIEAKAAQKKGFLDQYYGKYVNEAKDRIRIDERQARADKSKKEIQDARKKIRHIQGQGDSKAFEPFVEAYAQEVLERNLHANDPSLSLRARKRAFELHSSEPEYWTSIRLAALFKIKPAQMRGYLFMSKLEAQAAAQGEEMDDVVDEALADAFGEVDFPDEFDGTPPDEIPIKKVHNPWYFINPSIKSGELLKFSRSLNTVHYRECSRIPAQPVEPVKYFNEALASNAPPRKPYAPGKRPKWILFDSSPVKHLYNRLIIIRDVDGVWRTANWEERRKVHDGRRHIKYPFRTPFAWPDEDQPDGVPISAKAPGSFMVHFEDELDDVDLDMRFDPPDLAEPEETMPTGELPPEIANEIANEESL